MQTQKASVPQAAQPKESKYARKLRLEAEGKWKFPQQPPVSAPAPPVPASRPSPTLLVILPDGTINEKNWWQATIKMYRNPSSTGRNREGFGFVVVGNDEYFIGSRVASTAGLSAVDLYTGREVQVRLHLPQNGRPPEVKSIR